MNPSINQNYTSVNAKRTKVTIITLAVILGLLLLNFPLLHMLDTKRRLNNVSLPLTNRLASMTTDGLGPSGTNISFTVNKNYASPIEAKNDIIKQLESEGISILRFSDKPSSISLKNNGVKGKELPINEIAMTFFPHHYAFTFYLDQPIPCEPDPNSSSDDYLCGGEKRDDALEEKLINNQPIRAVNVRAAVKLF